MLRLNNYKLEKWDFVLGKDCVSDDNLTIMIKYCIYNLRENNKRFVVNELIQDLKNRKITDVKLTNNEGVNSKWVLFDSLFL